MKKIFFLSVTLLFFLSCSNKGSNTESSGGEKESSMAINEDAPQLGEEKKENPDSIMTDDWAEGSKWKLVDGDSTDKE